MDEEALLLRVRGTIGKKGKGREIKECTYFSTYDTPEGRGRRKGGIQEISLSFFFLSLFFSPPSFFFFSSRLVEITWEITKKNTKSNVYTYIYIFTQGRSPAVL